MATRNSDKARSAYKVLNHPIMGVLLVVVFALVCSVNF